MPVEHQVVAADEVRLALQTILASETFARSQQLSRLLKYLCDSLIAHGADRIAEYAIGTEALGRPSDFDPNQDAAVRVEMHRLRRRLRDYYDAEGAGDPVRIVIPPGQYAPVVTRTSDEHKDHVAMPPSTSDVDEVLPAEPLQHAPRRSMPGRAVFWLSIAGVVVVLVVAWLLWRRPGRATASGHPATAKVPTPIP